MYILYVTNTIPQIRSLKYDSQTYIADEGNETGDEIVAVNNVNSTKNCIKIVSREKQQALTLEAC